MKSKFLLMASGKEISSLINLKFGWACDVIVFKDNLYTLWFNNRGVLKSAKKYSKMRKTVGQNWYQSKGMASVYNPAITLPSFKGTQTRDCRLLAFFTICFPSVPHCWVASIMIFKETLRIYSSPMGYHPFCWHWSLIYYWYWLRLSSHCRYRLNR